jgi:hypothetical protein
LHLFCPIEIALGLLGYLPGALPCLQLLFRVFCASLDQKLLHFHFRNIARGHRLDEFRLQSGVSQSQELVASPNLIPYSNIPVPNVTGNVDGKIDPRRFNFTPHDDLSWS